MLTEFNKFKNVFQGNPEQIVNNLRANGEMSNEQFNQLKKWADDFERLRKILCR